MTAAFYKAHTGSYDTTVSNTLRFRSTKLCRYLISYYFSNFRWNYVTVKNNIYSDLNIESSSSQLLFNFALEYAIIKA
jgi:hypothetical protein